MFYSQGGEDSTVFNHFFSQPLKCGGTFVEMGALDGLTLSVSLFFERHLNWKGLLIEANPLNYELVVKNRPNTTSFGAAAGACPGGAIHFTGEGGLGHIIDEKMNPVLTSVNVSLESVRRVPCLPLGSLLKQAELKQIDLFILDVEGAEYSALQTMDWSIPVKVWIVEMAHSPNKPLIDLFAEHGYYDAGIDFVKECRTLKNNLASGIDLDIYEDRRHHPCVPATIFVRNI